MTHILLDDQQITTNKRLVFIELVLHAVTFIYPSKLDIQETRHDL